MTFQKGHTINNGRKLSLEIRNKISKGHLGISRKHTQESRMKMSIAKIGKNNPKWIEDRTKLKTYPDKRQDGNYYQWRKQVWLRDNWKCKIANPDCKGRIEAHHILSWTDYPELRYKINNGITLCHFHHPRKWEEEKRLSPYFMELVSVSKE